MSVLQDQNSNTQVAPVDHLDPQHSSNGSFDHHESDKLPHDQLLPTDETNTDGDHNVITNTATHQPEHVNQSSNGTPNDTTDTPHENTLRNDDIQDTSPARPQSPTTPHETIEKDDVHEETSHTEVVSVPPSTTESTTNSPTDEVGSRQQQQDEDDVQKDTTDVPQRSPRAADKVTTPSTPNQSTVTVVPSQPQQSQQHDQQTTTTLTKSASIPYGGVTNQTNTVATQTSSRANSLNTSSKERDHKYIGKNHPEFELTYYMMVGMRTTVSRVESRPFQDITSVDFKTATKQEFPKEGSSFTPALGRNASDFKFKDYCPEVFRHIRHFYKISPIEYITCVCGNYEFIEFISNSKSGQFFCYTHDFKFMIKTISKSESKFLRQILPSYYEHVANNPDTLLSRFFGMHRVKSKKLKKTHFLLMGSVFYTDFPHEVNMTVYDLKGSTQGRSVSPEERANPGGCVFKDNDFIDDGKRIILKPEHNERLRKQLERDVRFLQQLNIMDYSLLVGILDLETCEQNVVPLLDANGRPFSPYQDTHGVTSVSGVHETTVDDGADHAGGNTITAAVSDSAASHTTSLAPSTGAVTTQSDAAGIDSSHILSSSEHATPTTPTPHTAATHANPPTTTLKQSPLINPSSEGGTASLHQTVSTDGVSPLHETTDNSYVPSNKRLSVTAPSDTTQTSYGKKSSGGAGGGAHASPTHTDARLSVMKRDNTTVTSGQTRQPHIPTKYNQQTSKPSDFALDFQPLPTNSTGHTITHRLSLDDTHSQTAHHPPPLQPSISMQNLPTNALSTPHSVANTTSGPPHLSHQNALLVNSDILHVEDENLDISQLNAVDQRARTRTIIEQKKIKKVYSSEMQMTPLDYGQHPTNSIASAPVNTATDGPKTPSQHPSSPKRMRTVPDDLSETTTSVSVFTRDMGGIRGNGSERNKLYFLGIIDILTVYNWKKKGETWLKGLRYNKDQISSVSPERYADRFLDFMEQHALGIAPPTPTSVSSPKDESDSPPPPSST